MPKAAKIRSDVTILNMSQKTKLKFVLDKDYDREMIFVMLQNQNQAGLVYQAEKMEIDLELAKKIVKRDQSKEIDQEVKELVDARYQEIHIFIERSKELYQGSWNEINDQFFARLKELTDFPFQHDSFECVISAFHIGISSWGGNKIVRRWNYNPSIQRRITAHEIIISHFFYLTREKYPNQLSDQQIWKLAEIFAFIITGLDPVMIQFWPWDKTGSYTDHDYPEITDLQKQLTKIYQEKGFKAFIETGLEFVK